MAAKVAAEYLATARLDETSAPRKVRFTATGVSEAIHKLCATWSVKDTLEFYEFEILEIVGSNHYRPAASKLPTKGKKALVPLAPLPPIVEPKQEAMDRVGPNARAANVSNNVPKRDETSYTPYKLKVDV